MVDLPLDRLLQIGEANLEKDLVAFTEAARRIDGKSPADAMRSLASEHPTEANLIESAKDTAEKIRQFVVDRKIIGVPSETRATILPSPPYLRAGGFAFMDTPGPHEKANEAFYYITPPEKEWSADRKQQHPVVEMSDETSGAWKVQLRMSWFSYPLPVDAVKPTHARPVLSRTGARSTAAVSTGLVLSSR